MKLPVALLVAGTAALSARDSFATGVGRLDGGGATGEGDGIGDVKPLLKLFGAYCEDAR